MERDFLLNWSVLVEEAIQRRKRLNMTQRQLASLARISTPTVSRFEQNAKDIQLSSALAVLDALGLTDKRTLVFTDPASSYDMSRGVTFWGEDAEKRIRCRISREALDDHFSDGDRLRPEAAFKKYRPTIEGLVRRKYLLGQAEDDGTVLLKTEDIPLGFARTEIKIVV
jgi:transcriptional regulator with XRE-family HTH domain